MISDRVSSSDDHLLVWVIQPGEPLPWGDAPTRPYRSALLCRELGRRGHDVVWWTSSFDHFTRRQWQGPPRVSDAVEGVSVHFVRSPRYRRNVSLGRLVNHAVLARRLGACFRAQPRAPDVILSSFPPIETTATACRFAARERIPVVVDVRDLHPDVFAQAAPGWSRWALRPLLSPHRALARRSLALAESVVAISPSYLAWAADLADRRPGRDAVIPFGYPEDLAVPEDAIARASRSLRGVGVDPDSKIAWFVGTFGHSCDLETVIEAASLISAESGIQVVISGDGAHRRRIEALASQVESVVITGWLDTAGIEAMRRSAWVGLATYRTSAMMSLPNKIFEYMSARIPIVYSLGGDTDALLSAEQCGVRYQPGSPRSLASCLSRLAEDAVLYARLARNAEVAFESRFSASATTARLAELVEAVARTRDPSDVSSDGIRDPR